MRRTRTALLLLSTIVVAWACGEGLGPEAGSVPLDIAPSFQVLPGTFESPPIDRVVLEVTNVSTSLVVATADVRVDPNATSWAIPVSIDLGGEESIYVLVQILLYSGSSVEWSGLEGPILVGAGQSEQARTVQVYRGPLDNLDVTSVTILDPPTVLQVAQSVTLSAGLTLVQGSDASPEIFWASSDTAVATVTESGTTVTLRAVAAGTASIIAAAGPVFDEFTVEVSEGGGGGAGTLKTWVGGDVDGLQDWHNANNWNPPGVPGLNDTVVVAGLSYNAMTSTAVSVAAISVGGSVGVVLNAPFSVTGDVDAGGNGITNGQVTVTGAGTILQGTFGDLVIQKDRALSGDAGVLGDLVLADARLDVAGRAMTVSGNLDVSGSNGGLVMTNPDPQPVIVFGSALFNGGDHTGLLTEGTLEVGGGFHATNASTGSFVASGNHTLVLFGASAQDVLFDNPGPNAQRVNDLEVSTYAGVTFQSSVTVTGSIGLVGAAAVPSLVTVDVAQDLTLEYGSVVLLDGAVNVGGACIDNGATLFGNGTTDCQNLSLTQVDKAWVGGYAGSPTDWQQANNWIPSDVPGPTDAVLVPVSNNPPVLSANASVGPLYVTSSGYVDLNGFTMSVAGDVDAQGSLYNGRTIVTAPAAVAGYFQDLQIDDVATLTNTLYVEGNLDLNAPLNVGGFSLYVYQDLTVLGSGVLTMDNINAVVIVDGNATFDGASSAGQLTGGAIYFSGDLTVLSTNSPTSFQAEGTYTYIYGDGVTDQTLSFSNPGVNGQYIGDLYVYQAGQEALVLETQVTATGLVSIGNGLLQQGGAGVLEVTGELDLDLVTFDGVPLRLDSPVSPELHTLTSVTFTNFQADDTQFYARLPNAGPNYPLILDSPVFDASPPNPGYYIEAVNRAGAFPEFLIDVKAPFPADPQGRVLEGANTVILW